MQYAPIPADEADRMAALHSLNVLDTKPEERFDRITQQAISRFHVPISTISIIDSDREWFKSCQGTGKTEAGRDVSFCGHAMLSRYVFIVEDTLLDKRFADNPQVTGFPFIRFYAGVALHDRASGQPVGVFCIKDTKPRTLAVEEIADILDLARQAESELNMPVTQNA